ncbi:glutamate-5-semialdehyde dehydrogenase [Shewanella sp. 202IG2-18]|uniref:glutamate-5-semialdehyde dehydrogenase n=1 Tax=Parashewanella hymeniacidonis TaxID=2807618 RepID=UPI0019618BE4|nr:glutamate-5-semialdehyde dehydrogenase [Parashewanella hymeniacidonis]MBM7072575.1 glutamate-5-semialdehyde dehydrogenase [Parashewanella hymeniacidonis]
MKDQTLETIGRSAKRACIELASLPTKEKNDALAMIAQEIEINTDQILAANAKDMQVAAQANTPSALQDRLLLNPERLKAIVNDIQHVISLDDPIGSERNLRVLANGLTLCQRSTPLGVIGVIYEARPNVTVDIATLCLKTGNACILRGGKETLHSNIALIQVIHKALSKVGISDSAVQYLENTDRQLIADLLKLDTYIDMIIPRGGPQLQTMCKQQSTIPVIIGGFGISHIFVDDSAEITESVQVISNAKLHRPSACNSLDTLLVHEKIASQLLPTLQQTLSETVLFVVDKASANAMFNNENVRLAEQGDYDKEWLSNTLSIKVVSNIDAAIAHMHEHNASHSDSILTNNLQHAEQFLNQVNSAAVYVNASTRFTDGAQFGLGAEVAVSTQKLHARGPMGLEALTTYKWIGKGDYLIRT